MDPRAGSASNLRRGSALGGASILALLAGCGGPLRHATGPVESAAATASGPADVSWTCSVRADERWIAVDLALENRGAAPVEWPNPAPGAVIVVDADPDGACTIRVSRPHEPAGYAIPGAAAPAAVEVPAGATSHLLGGFAVVPVDTAPELRWSRLGPTVAVRPGDRCAVVCASVYWPPRVGEPPPPNPDGSYTVDPKLLSWLDPVVPISASPAEVGVTADRPFRVVLEVDPPAPLPTPPE